MSNSYTISRKFNNMYDIWNVVVLLVRVHIGGGSFRLDINTLFSVRVYQINLSLILRH